MIPGALPQAGMAMRRWRGNSVPYNSLPFTHILHREQDPIGDIVRIHEAAGIQEQRLPPDARKLCLEREILQRRPGGQDLLQQLA